MAESHKLRPSLSKRTKKPKTWSRWGAALIALVVLTAGWVLLVEISLWQVEASLETRSHAAAKHWLTVARLLNGRRADVEFHSARLSRRTGDFKQVEIHLRRAFELGWDVGQIKREQWLALAQTGQFDEVDAHWGQLFQTAGSDAPELSEAYVTACLARFRIEPAVGVLDAWQSACPDAAQPHVMRGRLSEAQLEWPRAVASYRKAVELAPDRIDARKGLARSLMSMLNYREAERYLQSILVDDPSQFDAKVSLANCRVHLGDVTDARRLFLQVLAESPDDFAGLRSLGELELGAGNPKKATDYLTRACEQRPENAECRFALARGMRAAGDEKAAEPHFKFVEKSTKPLAQLGKLISRLAQSPDDVTLRFQVAMITYQYKSREDGIKWLLSLLKIVPDHQPTKRVLAEHYARSESNDGFALTIKKHRDDSMHPSLQKSDDISPAARSDSELSHTTAARFVDMVEQFGPAFVPRNGEEVGRFSILETLGVGVALCDYDSDGDLDLFVPGGGTYGDKPNVRGLPSGVFRNLGDWQFADVTAATGFQTESLYSHGAVVGDYDDDGFADILVTGYDRLLLFHNAGDGTFSEVAQLADLSNDVWSTGAAWGDVDGDSITDLYVANYVDWSFTNNPTCFQQGKRDVCGPLEFQPFNDVLYIGNGDGTFHDGTEDSGLVAGGNGLAVLTADIDLDGNLDIYVANDATPNFLYRNLGTGNLEEIGIVSSAALNAEGLADGSMGIDVGDVDNDGLPDLWVANYEDQSFALYRNFGDFIFQHVSSQIGITAVGGVYLGFGTVLFDFDRDGDKDIVVTTGHVMNHPRNAPVRQPPLLMENLDGQRFTNVAAQAGPYFTHPHLGRGLAVGDIDNDGDLDLAISHTNDPCALLSNESPNSGNWLKLRLIGINSPRDAVGARVRVTAGSLTQLCVVKSGFSFLSSSTPWLFFGVRDSTRVDRIEVDWPSGTHQSLKDVPANQSLVVLETGHRATPDSSGDGR